ncbi:MAG: cysteine hydrolase family protein [Opitutales bacterium]
MSPAPVNAQPFEFHLKMDECAFLIIDMQRDFVEPGGFGESLGNDVSLLRSTILPTARLLAAWREMGGKVIHTREGHLPDLSDLPESKRTRGNPEIAIGDTGPMGRILIRGEAGQGIIPELAPAEGECVIDKPGKGAFYNTSLGDYLKAEGITQLIVAGVTTEVCVHTTVREANDRGYDCLVLSDCTGSYFPEFHEMALKMVVAQSGIFGWVSESASILNALDKLKE